jgi:hypothetical protein
MEHKRSIAIYPRSMDRGSLKTNQKNVIMEQSEEGDSNVQGSINQPSHEDFINQKLDEAQVGRTI